MLRPLTLLLALAVPVAGSRAQTTWIVNAAGGGNFLDLPQAVGAAADGDTILVQPGNYSAAFTISRGVTIIGAPGNASLISGIGLIHNLPRGRQVAIKRLATSTLNFVTIGVGQCAGTVLLEDLRLVYTAYNAGLCLDVVGSPNVRINRCYLSGGPALRTSGSQLLVSETQFIGSQAIQISSQSSHPGIDATTSLLDLSRCDVRGGDGDAHGNIPGQPAILANQTDLWLTGVGNQITGGTLSCIGLNCPQTEPSVRATGGAVHYDPTKVNLYRPISTTGAAISLYLPSLATAGVPSGQPLLLDLADRPGTFAAIMLSLENTTMPTPLGPLWLDPGSSGVMTAAPIPASGRLNHQVVVPPLVGRGVSVTFQAATLGTYVFLSNGVSVILE